MLRQLHKDRQSSLASVCIDGGVRIQQRDFTRYRHYRQFVVLAEVQEVLPHRVDGHVVVAVLEGIAAGRRHHIGLSDQRF